MSFFYDLNKKLAGLAAKTEQEQIAESKKAEAIAQSPLTKALNESIAVEADYSAKKARAGKDIGKPGKNFAKIAKGAAERYGSKEAGERVAGAVLNKLRHPKESTGMADEGNAFTGALAKTPKGGKFNVGGKEFTDTSSIEEEGSVPMTPKQKKFAKLAPPADKITFADKIAGAKKEVDEMLGDVAAEAMRKAVKGHSEEMDEGYAEMDAWLKKREAEKGTGKFDKKERTLPGGMKATTYTRKHEEEPEDDSDAPASKGGAPKKRGRPMGKPKGPERVTKGAWKHKGGRVAEESDEHVCEMCGQPIAEKAKSKAQQKFMGMVHATQKGEKAPSKEVAKVAKEMPKKAAKDFAATKHKGLPEKVKAKKEESKEEVEETTVAGSVATSTATPKAGKGMQFGKGVYESFNNDVEKMITESIAVETSMSECGEGEMSPTLTIQADGDEAAKLMMLLKLAGLEGQQASTCPTCGNAPCNCAEVVDENSPDWPTNTETIDADPNLRTYSGGLNGPKSTGQTTVPVIASQGLRQSSMEESVELERSLFDTWKNYKG